MSKQKQGWWFRFFSVFAVLGCLASLPANAQDDFQRALDTARQALDSDQLDDALMLLKKIEPSTPGEAAQIDLVIGKIYLKVGKPDKAIAFFEHAATSTMDDSEAYAGMAEATLKQGNLNRARRYAEVALRENDDLASAHLVLARADDRSGNVNAARERFKKISNERPENEDIAIAHASFLFERGDIDPAIRRLETFIIQHETAAGAHDALGRYYWAVGRYDEGLRTRAIAAVLYLDQGNTYRAEPIMNWVSTRDQSGEYVKGLKDPKLLYKDRPVPITAPSDGQRRLRPSSPSMPPQVVRLEPLPIPPGAYSQGTGFVVGDGQYVITNRHVIEGTVQIAVRNGIGQVRRAKVLKIAPRDDLAVLELSSPFPSNQAIPTTHMGDARPGRTAVVMGYPMASLLGEQMPSLTSGIVSKTTGFENDPTSFLLSTKVNKGNSGGPVFDNHGNLIGVVVSKLNTLKIYEERGFIPEDVNQAIKISRVFEMMGWPGGTSPAPDAPRPLALEDLYQTMLPKVVFIAGSLKDQKKK